MSNNKRQQVKTRVDIEPQHRAEHTLNSSEGKRGFNIQKILNANIITLIIFVMFCYWLLVVKNGYMLRWYEEMSLFDSSRFFFLQSLYYPGGLLRYAGAWLTQLMYYPILGSSVLILLWITMAWLTKKAYDLSRAATPLCLLVPICMLVSVVQLDEAWLSMNSAGYLFSNTLGFIFTISSVCLYRLTGRRPVAATIVLLLTAASYFFAGFYALLGSGLGAILMIADGIRAKKYAGLACAALAIAAIYAIPNLYYSYFNGTSVDNDYLYLKGLPDLLMEDFDAYLWRPFIVASVCLAIIAIISRIPLMQKAPRIMQYGSIAAVCVLAIWSVNAEHKTQQLRATVLMLKHMEYNDWRGMTDIMSRITEPPNLTMLILNNVAVINQGGPSARLDGIEPINTDSRHAEWFNMTAFVNIPVNYYEGLFNESYRWAMEHSVQYGKRVFYLKYMVKDALLNGETELARRYNDLLKGTMFHRKWAEEMQRYIDNPSLIETNPEFKSILELSRWHQSGHSTPQAKVEGATLAQ